MAETSNPIIPEAEMPAPRIEFRWRDPTADELFKSSIRADAACDYNFVIPLGEYDIRGEDEDGNMGVKRELTVKFGTTMSSGGGPRLNREFGRIDTPFRDGAHAQWDAKHMGNPPRYAVAEGFAQLLAQGQAQGEGQ